MVKDAITCAGLEKLYESHLEFLMFLFKPDIVLIQSREIPRSVLMCIEVKSPGKRKKKDATKKDKVAFDKDVFESNNVALQMFNYLMAMKQLGSKYPIACLSTYDQMCMTFLEDPNEFSDIGNHIQAVQNHVSKQIIEVKVKTTKDTISKEEKSPGKNRSNSDASGHTNTTSDSESVDQSEDTNTTDASGHTNTTSDSESVNQSEDKNTTDASGHTNTTSDSESVNQSEDTNTTDASGHTNTTSDSESEMHTEIAARVHYTDVKTCDIFPYLVSTVLLAYELNKNRDNEECKKLSSMSSLDEACIGGRYFPLVNHKTLTWATIQSKKQIKLKEGMKFGISVKQKNFFCSKSLDKEALAKCFWLVHHSLNLA